MIPSQALSLVRAQINEATANFWSDAEIYSYMWDAEIQLAAIVGYQQATSAHTTITDTSVYTLPDSTLSVARVSYDGKRLTEVIDKDIDNLNGTSYGSAIEAGKPEVYRRWDNNITLYPTPEEDKELYFEFYKSPTAIATASTLFTIKNPAINRMIPDYCVMMCMLKDTENSQVNFYNEKWQDNIAKAYQIKAAEGDNLSQSVRDTDIDNDMYYPWDVS